MRIGVDYSHGKDSTVMFVSPVKKGRHGRAQALQWALRQMGKDPSYGYCLHVVETDGRIEFDDLPDITQ